MTEEELFQEAKKRYPIGCKIDQRKAYDGTGGIQTIDDHNTSMLHPISFTLGGWGVYNPINNQWVDVIEYPPGYVSPDIIIDTSCILKILNKYKIK